MMAAQLGSGDGQSSSPVIDGHLEEGAFESKKAVSFSFSEPCNHDTDSLFNTSAPVGVVVSGSGVSIHVDTPPTDEVVLNMQRAMQSQNGFDTSQEHSLVPAVRSKSVGHTAPPNAEEDENLPEAVVHNSMQEQQSPVASRAVDQEEPVTAKTLQTGLASQGGTRAYTMVSNRY